MTSDGLEMRNDYYLLRHRDWIGRGAGDWSSGGKFSDGSYGTDPITYASVTVVLMLIGITACYVPARRAARLDPTEALRHD